MQGSANILPNAQDGNKSGLLIPEKKASMSHSNHSTLFYIWPIIGYFPCAGKQTGQKDAAEDFARGIEQAIHSACVSALSNRRILRGAGSARAAQKQHRGGISQAYHRDLLVCGRLSRTAKA